LITSSISIGNATREEEKIHREIQIDRADRARVVKKLEVAVAHK